ncbi:MAG: hypothetical protein R6V05_00440 [Candidatus Brocadiia bacterium]
MPTSTYYPNSNGGAAWEGESASSLVQNDESALSSSEEDNISSSDDTKHDHSEGPAGDEPTLRVRFDISEDAADVDELEVTAEGYGLTVTGVNPTTYDYDFDLHIWNASTSSWEYLGGHTSSTDQTVTESVLGDCADYINGSGYVYVRVMGPPADSFSSAGNLFTDLVKLEVTYSTTTYLDATATISVATAAAGAGEVVPYGSLSDYCENKWLDHLTSKAEFSAPETLWLALSTADPTETGAGLSEPSGAGYARVATSASDWTAASARSIQNVAELPWPVATGDWGALRYWAAMDAELGGNMLAYGELTEETPVEVGDVYALIAGKVIVSLRPGGWCTYLANRMLDHTFLQDAYTPPSPLYLALSTANPTDDGTGLSEPSGGSYSRVSVSAGDWTAASGGAVQNATAIEFPRATASWGVVSDVAWMDAATEGNVLLHGTLALPKTIPAGLLLRFAAGNLVMLLN